MGIGLATFGFGNNTATKLIAGVAGVLMVNSAVNDAKSCLKVFGSIGG